MTGTCKESAFLMFASCEPLVVSLTETSSKKAPTIRQNGQHSKRLSVKKLQSLRSSDHPILLKFHQLMVKYLYGITNSISDFH